MMTKTSLLLCFLISSQIALCNTGNFDAYLIIVGGGKTYNDAEMIKSHYIQQKELTQLIETKVEIILSDTVKGLNPGFYIAIIGCHTVKTYAQLIVNSANNYLNGVYMRKIEISSDSNYKKPVLMADHLPFEAQRNYCLKGINDYFLSDRIDNGTRLKNIAGSPNYIDEIYVNTSSISFVKKIGMLDVKYYMGWMPDKKVVVYVSQFQFSKIPKNLRVDFDGNIKWSCNGEGKRIVMSGEFKPYEFNETCKYSNGIETSNVKGYEYDNYSVSYPMDTYKFEDVVNYHIGKGHFKNLNDVNYQNGEFLNNGYKIKFLDNELSIESDDGHGWESIVIKDNFIIYEEGGGA